MFRRYAALVLPACLCAGVHLGIARAAAEPVLLAFDQRNAVIEFQPRVAGLLRPMGAFQAFQGSLALDPADMTHSAVSVRLRAAQIRVALPGGADKLRSADYFDAAHYPEIEFRSTGVQAGADGRLAMSGLLTIRGVTRPETLEVSVLPGAAPHQGLSGFRAAGSIRRSDFGMVADRLLVGDEIRLSIQVALDESGSQAVPARP